MGRWRGLGERHRGVTGGFWWEVSRDGHGDGAGGVNRLGQETPRDFGGDDGGVPAWTRLPVGQGVPPGRQHGQRGQRRARCRRPNAEPSSRAALMSVREDEGPARGRVWHARQQAARHGNGATAAFCDLGKSRFDVKPACTASRSRAVLRESCCHRLRKEKSDRRRYYMVIIIQYQPFMIFVGGRESRHTARCHSFGKMEPSS